MHIMWRFASLAAFLVLVGGSASAQPMTDIPQWREGQHVYVVPERWDAPLFGPNAFREMEEELKQLRYPFYVVIAAELNGSEDDEELGAKAADAIAERWANDGYDVGKSQIFVMGFEPRAFGTNAGKYFTTTAGMDPDQLIPHNRIFLDAMQGTPKDPQGGIIGLAKSLDAFLVDLTDPVKIAERAEAARQAALARAEAERVAREQERLRTARGTLDASILRLTELLESSDEVLPADTSSYRDLLAKAKEVRAKDDPAEMNAFAGSMAPSITTLADHVGKQQARITAERVRLTMIYGGIGIGILGILVFLILRRNRYLNLKEEFAASLARTESMVTNASGRYVEFDTSRDTIKELGELHGRTRELFETVSAEVDDIFASVTALKKNIGDCKLMAEKAGFWNFGPLLAAKTQLEGTFEFDTGEMNEGTLFGSETKIITIDMAKFTPELEARYKACIDGWNRLKEAREQMGRSAKELFPHANLDALMTAADAAGIPRRWLHDHPLYGDDAADEAVYAALDGLNLSDPIAFSGGIDALEAKEVEVTERLARIVELLKTVSALRSDTAPSTYGSLVDAGDDPATTFESARREDAAFMTLLATTQSLDDLAAQAAKTQALYRQSIEQSQAVKTAVDAIETTMTEAKEACAAATREQTLTQQRSLAAQKVHSNLNVTRDFAKGQASLKDAQTALGNASTAYHSRRLLTASRRAKEAAVAAKAASASFAEVVGACDAADAKRAAYLQAVAEMDARRDSAAAAIIGYGYSAGNLATFSAPRINGAADYAALTASLVATRESWALAEKKALQGYEAEQRRLREAEEARRREKKRRDDAAAAAATAARRRASSSSTSRGGGFGGGGSSSRGGSFGGGRSSSRGGKW